MSVSPHWLQLRPRQAGAVLLGLLVFVPRAAAHLHLTLVQHGAQHGHSHGHDHGHSHGSGADHHHSRHAALDSREEHPEHPGEDHLEDGQEPLLLEAPGDLAILWLAQAPAPHRIHTTARGVPPRPTAEPRPPPPRPGAPPRAPPTSS